MSPCVGCPRGLRRQSCASTPAATAQAAAPRRPTAANASSSRTRRTVVELCDGETAGRRSRRADARQGERRVCRADDRVAREAPRARTGTRRGARPAHGSRPPREVTLERRSPRRRGPRRRDTYGSYTSARREDLGEETERVRRRRATRSSTTRSSSAARSACRATCAIRNAANTHPETYPKFQAQLGRVALLRDMINWCIEHPVRASRSPTTIRGCARWRRTSRAAQRHRARLRQALIDSGGHG